MSVRFQRRKTIFWYSEHEYEPIAAPSPSPQPVTAPVVRITETDVVPVVDSDDSIDDRTRLPPELTKEGDVVLPLDGKIEDSAMEGRELVETGDTSEEQETPQQLQQRLEERFLNTATPGTESRTDGEVNTSQVDSSALEELPLRRDARGLPQRIKTQAGKLRSRLRNIQRPSFAFAGRQRTEKPRSTSSGKSDKSRTERRPSRMDRLRSSISERTKFSLPSRPKFNLPDRSKFHLPQRPKFNLPERPKFHLPERPKFNIKKPNIQLPGALTRAKKSPVAQQRSTDSTISSSRRNIFDFSTYPRIFDKKSKTQTEYATSTPKDSRAQSTESATFPRARKGTKWTQRYEEPGYIDEDQADTENSAERSHPWRHSAAEEPRLSVRMEEEILAAARSIPWEEKRRREQEEELQYMDYEPESAETSEQQPQPRSLEESRTEEESYERERAELDPRLYDEQALKEMYPRMHAEREKSGQAGWRAEDEMMMVEGDFRPLPRSRSLGETVSHGREEDRYEETFGRMDPRRFGPPKLPSEEEEYEEDMDEGEEDQEPSSAQSDREQQQSSGSSCDRRRRGVIEEIDSDEFFLRESGLSQDDMNLGKYIAHEIRGALRSEGGDVIADEDVSPVPPQRPMRTRSLKKRKEESFESYNTVPPVRPKRERSARRSEEPEFRERTRSGSRHRVVYQAVGSRELTPVEPLDDIVVVKPIRRKSRSSRSQSQPPTEPSSIPSKIPSRPASPSFPSSTPPAVPIRRKRTRRVVQRNGDAVPVCNGHAEWVAGDSAPEKPLPLPPTSKDTLDDQEVLTAEEIIAASEEDFQKLAKLLRDEEYVEPVPVAPKRRSRSRGPSVAQDEDRTSHGAESLPEAGYVQEDIPRDDIDSARDLSGYAIVEKREKPPRPPPPRRKKDKFATAPRSTPPKRPQRAYSTLGPSKSRDANILFEPISGTLEPAESGPYIEIEDEEAEHKDLRSGQVLSKMQGRPLPAPPRPPRIRKERSLDRATRSVSEFGTETTTATQTDPLPDDMIIEEEITQAKLVVTPSISGSQIMVSTERIPTPGSMPTPPVPPLPVSQRLRREEAMEPSYDTVSLKSPSPIREHEDGETRHLSAPDLEDRRPLEEMRERAIRSALLAEEPVRIGSLEVGDLRVDRLSVSQIEASKIVASEVDALVITASEMKNIGGQLEENLSPSIIRELIAIRSHLEAVSVAQAQERQMESRKTAGAQTKTDIPITDSEDVREPRPEGTSPDTVADQPSSVQDERSKPSEDQKVVKTEIVEVKDMKETPVTHTLSVAQTVVMDKEIPVTHTLSVSQIESKDKETRTTHSALPVVQSTQDKSLRILDSETSLSLSSTTGKEPKVGDSRASRPSSLTALHEEESRLSPERTSEYRSAEQLEYKRDDQTDSRTEFEAESPEHIEHPASRDESTEKECSPEKESEEKRVRKSRSRSPSPIEGMGTRQTASPVRSLPPAISVTPDTPDIVTGHGIAVEVQPQRAVISYSSHAEQSERESQRESSQSPISFPPGGTHFIAFPASQIPAQFFSITEQTGHTIATEPSLTDTMTQLFRALRHAGIRAMRNVIGNLSLAVSGEESREKVREVELTICALLLLIAGLLTFFLISPRTITHHYHWDYFNPPQ